jgi:hypothetical protein
LIKHDPERFAFTMFLSRSDQFRPELGFSERRGEMRYGLEALEARKLLSTSILAEGFTSALREISAISVPAVRSIAASVVAQLASSISVTQKSVAAPSALTAEAMSGSQVSVSWKNNSAGNSVSDEVLRSMDGVHFSKVATLASAVTSYTDSNLAAGTKYSYEIAAVDNSGNIAISSIAPTTTAALIQPGTGFTGPTVPDPTVQNVDPTRAGYNESAIANWDVVPYQTFSGQFNVGVAAFQMNGIKEVDFSVNGGAWTKVTQMTLNPQTANQTGVGDANAGVVEYWATSTHCRRFRYFCPRMGVTRPATVPPPSPSQRSQEQPIVIQIMLRLMALLSMSSLVPTSSHR